MTVQLLGTLVRENLVGWRVTLVSVPAWPLLFSSHDVRLRHERRYTPAAARPLIRGAGLEIIRSAGLFHSLILPRALQVARERLTGQSEPPADVGQWNAPAVVTALVRGYRMRRAPGAPRVEGWLESSRTELVGALPQVRARRFVRPVDRVRTL